MSATIEIHGYVPLTLGEVTKEMGEVLRLLLQREDVPHVIAGVWNLGTTQQPLTTVIDGDGYFGFYLDGHDDDQGPLLFIDKSSGQPAPEGSPTKSMVVSIGGGAENLGRCLSVALAIALSRLTNAEIEDIQRILRGPRCGRAEAYLRRLALPVEPPGTLQQAVDQFWEAFRTVS